MAHSASLAEQEGSLSKEQVRSLIKNAASNEYSVPESAVTAYIDDRRLAFPDCGSILKISFPFSDRSTSEITCELPDWKRYIRIAIEKPYSVFTYNRSMKAGDSLLRSDLKITQTHSASDTRLKPDQLQNHLGLSVAQDTLAGSIVMLSDFEESDSKAELLKQTPEILMVWVSKATVARNTVLRRDDFEFINGDKLGPRLPHDLVSDNFDFTAFEVTKTLLPGDILRRSILRIAPAVKVGDILTLNIQKGPLRLTTKVEALESGMIAEDIQVRSLDSEKRLTVRIRGRGAIALID
jgi:flagella basal body P-ring formation protein FlgA